MEVLRHISSYGYRSPYLRGRFAHYLQSSIAPRGDQGAEIWLAKTSSYYGDLWPRQSDGVRHPMWSWIARSVSHPDDQVFFTNGKWLNTAICCAFLGGLGFFANRTIGPLACANLLLLASLGVLVVRGPHWEPEPVSTFSPLELW